MAMPNNDLISRDAAKEIVSFMACAPTIKIAAEHKIDDLPAVDAIPVAWLNRLSDLAETSNRMLYHSIHVVTSEWNRWKDKEE